MSARSATPTAVRTGLVLSFTLIGMVAGAAHPGSPIDRYGLKTDYQLSHISYATGNGLSAPA